MIDMYLNVGQGPSTAFRAALYATASALQIPQLLAHGGLVPSLPLRANKMSRSAFPVVLI